MTAKKLTQRQKLFVKEYLMDLNGTQAAIRAGFTQNEKSASVIASRLLADVKVSALIAEGCQELEKKLDISIEQLWHELACIAFSDIRRYYHSDGSLKKISEVDEDAAAALRVFEDKIIVKRFGGVGQPKTVRVVKIRLWDKLSAIEKLLKLKFRVAEKVESTNWDSVIATLHEGRARAARTGK